MSKIAVYDIDGVLADFNELLVDMFGVGRGEEFYKLEDRYRGTTLLEAKRLQVDANYYYPLKTIPAGMKFVKQTLERGYEVLFLTNRPDVGSMKRFTERWLDKQLGNVGVEFRDTLGVVFTGAKDAFLAVRYKDIAFFVDDNPDEVEAAKSVGVNAFTWAQPWNEHVFPKLYPHNGEIWVQSEEWDNGGYFWSKFE